MENCNKKACGPKRKGQGYLWSIPLALLFVNMGCQKKNWPTAQQMELNANWTFSRADSIHWLPATVPGNVHTDLESNGIIDNPYYGTNEYRYQWIEHKDWIYRGKFDVSDALLRNGQIELEFEGLDTYADVTLNGHPVIQSQNMFVAHRADIKTLLVAGENHLEVYFHSPIKRAMPLHQKSKFTYPADNDRSEEHLSVYTRKAPYHYGWDWGPRFVTSGIWRPVKLHVWNEARFDDVHFVQHELTDRKASLSFQYEIESAVAADAVLSVQIEEETSAQKTVRLEVGHNSYTIQLEVDNPRRWWPNGMGKPHLYSVNSELKTGGVTADIRHQKIGLRTIEVVNQPDSLGESFYFKVNGIPTYMKGVNYIPNDCFLGRMTDSVYIRNIKDAVESNFNMIRFWGGGVYEDSRLFDLADENGILLWQDFMFACTMYPSDSAFLQNVADEARYNIRRLRNHPSLAIWCGNNEIKVGWHNWGWQQSYGYSEAVQQELLEGYDKLFNRLLPDLVRQYDPGRFYYDSSPISNWGDVADMKTGDNHYWGVWWGKHEFSRFNEFVPRFMSEFGFQSFPSMETIRTFSDSASWDIDSDIMKAHQKSSIGNVTIREYMERDYVMPQTFPDFVYLSQVMQAEGMRIGFEAHRRHKPFNMGTLYWQFNDVWPVVSWSGIDYYGRWKPMQYFVKKAFEPVVASAHFEKDRLKVHLISDERKEAEVTSTLQIVTLAGKTVWEQQAEYLLQSNENRVVLDEETDRLFSGYADAEVVLVMTTHFSGKSTETVLLFDRVKHLNLQKPEFDIRAEVADKAVTFHLKSNVFVKNVELHLTGEEGRWSDNYFDVVPGRWYKVTFHGNRVVCHPREKIQIHSVNQTLRP